MMKIKAWRAVCLSVLALKEEFCIALCVFACLPRFWGETHATLRHKWTPFPRNMMPSVVVATTIVRLDFVSVRIDEIIWTAKIMEHLHLIRDGARLFRLLSDNGTITEERAMIMVGIDSHLAKTPYYKQLLQNFVDAETQGSGAMSWEMTTKAMVERTVEIYKLCKFNPCGQKSRELSVVMRLSGWSEEQARGGSAAYQKCFRKLKREGYVGPNIPVQNKPRSQEMPSGAAVPKYVAKASLPSLSDIPEEARVDFMEVSPLSVETPFFDEGASTSSSAVVSNEGSAMAMLAAKPSAATIAAERRARKKAIKDPIIQVIGGKQRRKTTKQAAVARRSEKELDDVYKSAYKVATVLYWSVRKGENPLVEELGTANQVAEKINELFGLPLITGRQLEQAYKRGDRGVSPPKAGRTSSVPVEDFTNICRLVYTFCALQQANVEVRSSVSELSSVVGAIVNGKRQVDQEDELRDEAAFFQRILRTNSRLQMMESTDKREVRRVLWMSYELLKKHYTRWEATLLELGFARPAESDDKKSQGNIVILCPERIIQADEAALTLNGDDEKAGGRPSMFPVAEVVPDGGEPAQKTSAKCTLLQAINFADEVLPPFFIFPTQGQGRANYARINPKTVESFHQVEGQYGLTKRFFFDPLIAKSKIGSMTAELWKTWITTIIPSYYPDTADIRGKRVLIKADSGPGRGFGDVPQSWLAMARDKGIYFFPGLPNGTEIAQEMDQLFGPLKKRIYNNRDKLWDARLTVDGASASLSLDDIGSCVFGGNVNLKDGSHVTLENAFLKGLTPALIQGARLKCGYCPATRAALKSNRVRHQIIEATDGDVDATADPLGALYQMLEKDNKEAANMLIDAGYPENQVSLLVKSANRLTIAQIEGRQATATEPNTRERQDALEKVKSAGDFFRITLGGDIQNSSDMLFAFERRAMKKKAEKLEKMKAACQAFQAIKDKAVLFLQTASANPTSWTKEQLALCIRYYQGMRQPKGQSLQTKTKAQLVLIWTECQRRGPPGDDVVWSDRQEAKLRMLQIGHITSLNESRIFGKAIAANDEILQTRILNHPPKRRVDILCKVFQEIHIQEVAKVCAGALAALNERADIGINTQAIEDCLNEMASPRSLNGGPHTLTRTTGENNIESCDEEEEEEGSANGQNNETERRASDNESVGSATEGVKTNAMSNNPKVPSVSRCSIESVAHSSGNNAEAAMQDGKSGERNKAEVPAEVVTKTSLTSGNEEGKEDDEDTGIPLPESTMANTNEATQRSESTEDSNIEASLFIHPKKAPKMKDGKYVRPPGKKPKGAKDWNSQIGAWNRDEM